MPQIQTHAQQIVAQVKMAVLNLMNLAKQHDIRCRIRENGLEVTYGNGFFASVVTYRWQMLAMMAGVAVANRALLQVQVKDTPQTHFEPWVDIKTQAESQIFRDLNTEVRNFIEDMEEVPRDLCEVTLFRSHPDQLVPQGKDPDNQSWAELLNSRLDGRYITINLQRDMIMYWYLTDTVQLEVKQSGGLTYVGLATQLYADYGAMISKATAAIAEQFPVPEPENPLRGVEGATSFEGGHATLYHGKDDEGIRGDKGPRGPSREEVEASMACDVSKVDLEQADKRVELGPRDSDIGREPGEEGPSGSDAIPGVISYSNLPNWLYQFSDYDLSSVAAKTHQGRPEYLKLVEGLNDEQLFDIILISDVLYEKDEVKPWLKTASVEALFDLVCRQHGEPTPDDKMPDSHVMKCILLRALIAALDS